MSKPAWYTLLYSRVKGDPPVYKGGYSIKLLVNEILISLDEDDPGFHYRLTGPGLDIEVDYVQLPPILYLGYRTKPNYILRLKEKGKSDLSGDRVIDRLLNL